MERLTLERDGRAGTGLAVRLDRPGRPRDPALAVLYCHGFLSSQDGEKAAFFRRRAVESGLAFCSFDFQGHGGSEGGLLELTISRCLADLGRVRAWLAGRGFARTVLFGSSMGGFVAMWSSALDPAGVVAAVHVAPALDLDRRLVASVGAAGARRWQRDGRRRFDHELGTAEIGWGMVEDLRGYATPRLLALYRTPTLLLQGKNDASVPWRRVVDFAARCPFDEIEVHLLADGDHRLLDRRPHLWRLAESFLDARGILGRGEPAIAEIEGVPVEAVVW